MARKRVGRTWAEDIRTTSNVADKKLNILTWGREGTGKTQFMGTCPKPFIIAAEDGVLTLHNEEIPYYLLKDDEKIFDTVMQVIDDAKKGLGIFEDIETICIDSMSKLNSMIFEEIKEEVGDTKGYVIYEMLLTRMTKINSALVSAPYHYVISVGEAVKEDRLTETLRPVFNMTGSFRDQLAYEFDLNLYMAKKSRGAREEWIAYTSDENKRSAKSRVTLPREIKNLTFNYLWTEIQKELKTDDNSKA